MAICLRSESSCLKSRWTLSWPKHCWHPASLTVWARCWPSQQCFRVRGHLFFLGLPWSAFYSLRHLFVDNVLFWSVPQRQVATWTWPMRLSSVTGGSSTLKAITSPSSTSTMLSNEAKRINVTHDSLASFKLNLFIIPSFIDVIWL